MLVYILPGEGKGTAGKSWKSERGAGAWWELDGLYHFYLEHTILLSKCTIRPKRSESPNVQNIPYFWFSRYIFIWLLNFQGSFDRVCEVHVFLFVWVGIFTESPVAAKQLIVIYVFFGDVFYRGWWEDDQRINEGPWQFCERDLFGMVSENVTRTQRL